ncbi:unnamed protein product [Malus baccata var. baccata]
MTANIAWLKKFRLRQRRKNTKLTDLPFDILVYILKRLLVKSLSMCIRDLQEHIVNMQLSQSLSSRVSVLDVEQKLYTICKQIIHSTQFPLFIFRRGFTQFVWALFFFICYIFLLFNTWISQQFVFCNLFCFKVENCENPYCILFDPFKGEVLPLSVGDVQVPEEHCIYDKYGMGFDDLTSTHKNMVALVLVLGTNSWRKIHSVPPHHISSSTSLLSANGDMHWLIHLAADQFSSKRESYMRLFILNSRVHSFLSYAPISPHPIQSSNMRLFILRGFMAFMAVRGKHVEILVLKNYERKEWTREYTINLLVDDHTLKNHPRIANCGQWEHGIFFLDSHNNALFFDVRCPDPSLKHYGNVIDQEQVSSGIDLESSEFKWTFKKNVVQSEEHHWKRKVFQQIVETFLKHKEGAGRISFILRRCTRLRLQCSARGSFFFCCGV